MLSNIINFKDLSSIPVFLIFCHSLPFKGKSISDVLVISMDNDISACVPVASAFRNNGINAEIYTLDKKIKAKFKYAEKLKIPYIAIIGEDERKNGKVTIKDLKTGDQKTLTINEAIDVLKG